MTAPRFHRSQHRIESSSKTNFEKPNCCTEMSGHGGLESMFDEHMSRFLSCSMRAVIRLLKRGIEQRMRPVARFDDPEVVHLNRG